MVNSDPININTVSKEISYVVNFIHKLKSQSKSTRLTSVSFTLKPEDCINGKAKKYDHPLSWSVQQYYCVCDEGWAGLLCDLKKTDVEYF